MSRLAGLDQKRPCLEAILLIHVQPLARHRLQNLESIAVVDPVADRAENLQCHQAVIRFRQILEYEF